MLLGLESFLGHASPRCSHPLCFVWVSQKLIQSAREGLAITRWHTEAIHFMLQPLANSSNCRRNDRRAVRHGFEPYQAKRFRAPTREDDEGRFAVMDREFRRRSFP